MADADLGVWAGEAGDEGCFAGAGHAHDNDVTGFWPSG